MIKVSDGLKKFLGFVGLIGVVPWLSLTIKNYFIVADETGGLWLRPPYDTYLIIIIVLGGIFAIIALVLRSVYGAAKNDIAEETSNLVATKVGHTKVGHSYKAHPNEATGEVRCPTCGHTSKVLSWGQSPTAHFMCKCGSLIETLPNHSTAADEVSPPTPPSSISTELQTITDLHKAGALTDIEFSRAKSRILGE